MHPPPQVLGALACELSGDVLLLVACLGLGLMNMPPLRNGFRKPEAGDWSMLTGDARRGGQGIVMEAPVGRHMAAAEEYEQ